MHVPRYPSPGLSCPCLWDRVRTDGAAGDRAALTRLRGLPPSLLDVLLRLVAQLDLQLLGLHLQVSLPLRESFSGLGSKDVELITGSETARAQWAWPPFLGCCSVAKLHLTLCNPTDCSMPYSPVTISWSLLIMSIELVMPSNHLALCHPFYSCL